ncbi:MAG: DegT/DnrJ/EryC1/StrS family aminotransferase [Acidobacteriota bacterium]|nr:MAG: DegT/DnrJ/EryC1/StrS family aminotransferase [Acidobacteriota bacterium]
MTQKSAVKVPFLDLVSHHRPLLDELTAAFREAAEKAAFVGGPAVESFERAFATFCGTKHAIGVANGTDALRLAYLAAGIGPGDEVITAANTFIATVEAISQTGATPVLADIDPKTRLLDASAAEAAISPRTKALVPVHLYGQPAPMDTFRTLADKHGLVLIEDAAQAHGARWKGQRTGGLSDIAAFSFSPGKNLGSCGEGGAVTTDDDELARKVRMLRDHGQAKKYHHELEGYNARLHAIQARFLEIKLRHLDDWNATRRDRAARYSNALAGIEGVRLPFNHSDAESVWHLYVIETEGRDELGPFLGDRGVATGLHYPIPLHLQPPYARLGKEEGAFPHTERSARDLLSLPMFPELTDEQIDWVADGVKEWVDSRS